MRRRPSSSQTTALLEALPQLAWVHGGDIENCTFNAQWHGYLGIKNSALDTGAWFEYLHPDDRTAVLESWRSAVSHNEPYKLCYRIAHRSGSYRHLISSGVSRSFHGAEDPLWLTVTLELEHHGCADANRMRLEQRLQALQKTSNVVFWIADPDGQVSENWGWSRLTAQGDEEALGWGWIDTVHPEDRNTLIEAWQKAVENNQPFHGEYRLRSRDGAFRWVEGRASPIQNSRGEVLEWIGTVSDIAERKQKERELVRSEERLRLAIESTQLGIWDVDFASGERNWNDRTREILEIDKNEKIDQNTFLDLVHKDDLENAEKVFFQNSNSNENIYSDEYRIITAKTKRQKWVAATGRTLTDEQNRPVRKLGTIRDITGRKLAHLAAQAGEKQLNMALDAAKMSAWEINLDTGFVKRSLNAEKLFGFGSGPIEAVIERVHPEDRDLVNKFIHDCENIGQINFRYHHPDGRVLWLGMRGEPADKNRLRGVTFDITAQVEAEQELRRMAHEDDLTGLLNRSAFNKLLKEKCRISKQVKETFYILIADIDDFKYVNDALGHAAGDTLLKRAARRIRSAFGGNAHIARIGGDEFAILSRTPITESQLSQKINRLHQALRKPVTISGRTFSTQSSLGIASFPKDGSVAAELMKSADVALYSAKNSGRNRSAYYSPHMREKIIERIELFSEFDRALAKRELVVFYQPKVAITTGRIVGYEALLRWQHPSRGLLTPGVFGMVFENFELSQAIGKLVLEQITDDLHHWRSIGLDPGRIAVNLSAADFFANNLSDNILDQLEKKSLPTSCIEVEITEDVFLNNSNRNNDYHLKKLNDAGIKIALDDFGTGYASLTHLKLFPIDHIKIDKSFIDNIESDQKDKSIVSVIIKLSKELNLTTTAEGVENRNQFEILKSLSCCNIQGHLVSPAIHPRCIENFKFSMS